MVVNKGNLGALQDITDELYAAVANRTDQFVDLMPRLAELTASLDRQTDDIIAAADALARFSGTLARNNDSLRNAIDSLPGGAARAQRQPPLHRRRVRRAAQFRYGGGTHPRGDQATTSPKT